MKIYKTRNGILIEENNQGYLVMGKDWEEFILRENLYNELKNEIRYTTPLHNKEWLIQNAVLPPIGRQEVWAAGVTYFRSKEARMEESAKAGGATFYDKVYEAERPELFFKATASRTVGTNDYVNIRKDSTWDVPEPELTLLISPKGKIIGYTIGNDMSSRSIEGENPLYLPQAKMYDRCAALGPCIFLSDEPIPKETEINIQIRRNQLVVFEGITALSQIKRNFEELVEYLYRECSFPYGSFLMTGTGLVPPASFTLKSKDEISISIDHIGTLVNWVG
ncbi:MAG: 2-hydroxyhepta-2,4-diene-1,7-dioate isomerase [Cytophagales bacterium]|nr:MAG: 2-hydroxyhepta-2,4-diene-1,7-dioate isomerase [Cytophagales bacterium]